MPATPEQIRDRIRWTDAQLQRLDGLSWLRDHAMIHSTLDAICDAVRALPDGHIDTSSGTTRLTMLGITTTCTAGATGALHNWINRARRDLPAE